MFDALVLVTLLFVALLFIKRATTLRFCALCTAVSGTWIGLLGLYYSGYYDNETVIALFLGQTIVGTMYLGERNLPDRYSVFTLPYLLTGTVIGYLLLDPGASVYAGGLVLLTWLLAVFLFAYREHERVAVVFDEIIACCRDW